MTPKLIAWINTSGIFLVLVGAWFVAIEVVNRFRGEKFERTPTVYGSSPPPAVTEEYAHWEGLRSRHMKIGLASITIGSLLQITSIWL